MQKTLRGKTDMSNTISAIMPTYYNQIPVAFEHGKGAWLWDTAGKQYLDSLSGIAVCSLGHAHPAITAAICAQAGKLLHTSNTFHIPSQQQLAKKLIQISGMEQAFFCNSGAEANETALKITRLFAKQKNIANPTMIIMENAFHGRTLATLSASGSDRLQVGFEPLVPGFIRVPFNDLKILESLAKQDKNIVAVMVEPIQGEGGIYVPDDNYFAGIRAICDANDWLMIIDEIQTGIGRTGKWFAYQYNNILPDVLTVAKALGNGVPIGACLARGKACNLFAPGKHGSTFGGNPLACTTALAVLNTIEHDNILQNATEMGAYLQHRLKEQLSSIPNVVAVRGKGLMIGVQLDRPCRDLVAIGVNHGLLFNVTADKVIRLLPPLIITKSEADQIVARLKASIEEFLLKTK